jgi:hypothetical protein
MSLLALRYWCIRRLAGRASLLVNAELDWRGCVLTVPAYVADNVFRPGAKFSVIAEDGQVMTLADEA